MSFKELTFFLQLTLDACMLLMVLVALMLRIQVCFFCFGVLAEAMISLRNLVKLKGYKLKILEIIENAFKEKQALCH